MKIGWMIGALIFTLAAMFIGAVVHNIVYASDVSNQRLIGDKFFEFIRAHAILALIASAVAGYLLVRLREAIADEAENSEFLLSVFAGAAIAVFVVYLLEALLVPAGASRSGLVVFSFVGLLYRDSLQTWNLIAAVGSGVVFGLVAVVFTWLSQEMSSNNQ